MRLSSERCLRVPLRSSFLNSRMSWRSVRESTRAYAKAANPYTNTIALPKTDYALWPKHDKIREDFMNKCVNECYKWQSENLLGESLILHDGPPYANGDLHLGHALNKILKDIILRYNILQGRKVSYIPGWDCHGLPIELKAVKSKADKYLPPATVRRIARAFAEKTVLKQMDGFKGWVVLGDWEKRWCTMDREYEVRQLEVFLEMVKKGMIYRRLRPVYWSPSTGTALAEAELEYKEDHASTAVYVRFPLVELGKLEGLVQKGDTVSAVIWTTTPWTLPANRAIAINPSLTYLLISISDNEKLLVAESLAPSFASKLSLSLEDLKIIPVAGTDLLNCKYKHPLIPTSPESPILPATYVTADSGTGLVHSAPGHGAEDYGLLSKYDVSPFSPVNDKGEFTDSVTPESLRGLPVLGEGNEAVVELLRESGALVFEHIYKHKYPYDWRSKEPVIVRATKQWFANVENIKDTAVEAVQGTKMIPESGIARLTSFVQGRSEWCISRQRAWGVPIPALYDVETGEALLTADSVQHIISVIREKGTDVWFSEDSNQEWVAPQYRGREYRRGTETMDVWFDSGTSWSMLQDSQENKKQADIYLEGTDQHRGWFQSSLLTSVAVQDISPFKTLITHGFVLDKDNTKMSKSLGNIISPQEIVDGKRGGQFKGGVDGLRMWVASSEYTTDVAVNDTVLTHVLGGLQKTRATLRYLIGNIHDANVENVEYKDLSKLDQYALHQIFELNKTVKHFYDEYEFFRVAQAVNTYTATSLSRNYFSDTKDIMYCDAVNSPRRRAVQYTFSQILLNYLSMLSPLIPLYAEEAWHHTPQHLKREDAVYKLGWFEPPALWYREDLNKDMQVMESLKESALKILEQARKKQLLGNSLQADLVVTVPNLSEAQKLLQEYNDELKLMLQVSYVKVTSEAPNITGWAFNDKVEVLASECQITIMAAARAKCPRCWTYASDVEGKVCERCAVVLSEQTPSVD